MSKHDCQTIRELGYKSCIPYFIMFDPDLNQQHLKLYALIEQMESNPNPKVNPTFSYSWFASLLGTEIRAAMKISKTMKDKGYLTHTQKADGRWIWGTAKKIITDDSLNDTGGVSQEDGGGVSWQDTGGVSQEDTLNTIKNKNYKEEITKLVSSSFTFSKSTDKSLLNQKLERDNRTPEEFLAECAEHVDNHSNQKFPRSQRANALVKLLTKLHADNVIFRPPQKEEKPEEPRKVTALFTEQETQLMQEYLHAKKMADWGNDINVFMPNADLREKAKGLLERAKIAKESPCQNPSPSTNAKARSLSSVSNLASHLRLSAKGS